MTQQICLRCDWQGRTKDAVCPTCGARPLYVAGVSRSARMRTRARNEPEEPSHAPANTARSVSSLSPPVEPDQTALPAGVVDPVTRSPRRAVALVVVALVLAVILGNRLDGNEKGSPVDASIGSAAPGATTGIPPMTPTASLSSEIAAVGPTGRVRIGRNELTAEGAPFSITVRTSGWERFGHLSLNKSTVGSQGAEAIIYWTNLAEGAYADPCGQWWGSPVGSLADFAIAASRIPGTDLVTAPSNVTVGGYAAKHVVFTVREDVGCDPGFLYTWKDVRMGAFWPGTAVGDTINIWLVRLRGQVLYIEGDASTLAGPDLEREIQQIVGSIRFG